MTGRTDPRRTATRVLGTWQGLTAMVGGLIVLATVQVPWVDQPDLPPGVKPAVLPPSAGFIVLVAAGLAASGLLMTSRRRMVGSVLCIALAVIALAHAWDVAFRIDDLDWGVDHRPDFGLGILVAAVGATIALLAGIAAVGDRPQGVVLSGRSLVRVESVDSGDSLTARDRVLLLCGPGVIVGIALTLVLVLSAVRPQW
jgi:hypothetical protein